MPKIEMEIEYVWLAVSTLCNQVYYYDAVTRETSWVRPTAANIITQQELEALAAADAAEKAQASKTADASDAGV